MILVSSSSCGPCRIVHNTLWDKKIEHEKINADTEEGKKWMKEHDIQTIPTIIDGDRTYVGATAVLPFVMGLKKQ